MSELKEQVSQLPQTPGIYKFFDKQEKVIYVGKAKNLKRRVASYFTAGKHIFGKTKLLVAQIQSFEVTLVETEYDALLLENSIIKKLQPKYNVALKDGKTYPCIMITHERFPRVLAVRKIEKNSAKYFGPYANPSIMYTLLELIKNIFPLRTCTYNLSEKNVDEKKYKLCLDYHLGNCLGPCEGLQNESDYLKSIDAIENILQGNLGSVIGILQTEMLAASGELQFEQAAFLKNKIELLKLYKSKSTIVRPHIHNVDVFSISSDEKMAFVNYLKVMNGTIVHTKTMEVAKKLGEPDTDILPLAISTIRRQFKSVARELIVPFKVNYPEPEIKITVPQKGDKEKLLKLSLKNVMYYKKDILQTKTKQGLSDLAIKVLTEMKSELRMKELPTHIEGFDNSNFQGAHPVSSMVYFMNGKPLKSHYRHYNIKSVEGPNDFASMYEVVWRRYRRMMDEEQPIPQLIVIDGGKGQLSSAVKALKELGIYGKSTIIGIAKKLEEIYFPEDHLPMMLSKKSPSLQLIQKIRNEAHRFAITFHKNKRSISAAETSLEKVKGLGKSSVEKLLAKYGSMEQIRNINKEDLAKTVGKHRANLLTAHFTQDTASD